MTAVLSDPNRFPAPQPWTTVYSIPITPWQRRMRAVRLACNWQPVSASGLARHMVLLSGDEPVPR